MNNNTIATENHDYVLGIFSPEFIWSAVVGLITVAMYIVVSRISKNYYKKHLVTGTKATLMRVIFSVIHAIIVISGILIILEINGVNVTSMLAGLGIASAIVGFALQDILKDIIMGVHILTDRFFSIGDCVLYEGREGVIEAMTLKTTKIRDLDDLTLVTICNRNISEMRLLAERLDLDIPLSYTEDVRKVHETLKKICDDIAAQPLITSCEYKGTKKFEESDILYTVRITCEPKERPDVKRIAIKVVQEGLEAAGISIPYNQLDVHCDIVNK